MLDNIKLLEKSDKLPPILLLFGEEEFLLDEALSYIQKTIVPKISQDYDIDVVKSDETTLNKVVDICRSYPFMSEKRTVIIKNFDKYFSGKTSKKTIEKTALYKYINNPPDTTFLVLTATYDSINGLTKFMSTNKDKAAKTMQSAKYPFDMILSKHEWIEYPKVWDNTFPAWIKNRLKAKGKTINDRAIEILISHTNPTLRDISNELEKLLIYVMDRVEINEDDAISVVGTSRQFNVFELQKAVGKRNLFDSINILKNMLDVDRCEMLVLTILTKYFISLMKLLEEPPFNDQTKYAVASKIGVSPFFLNEYVQSKNLYGYKRIDRAFLHLIEADEALKTGSTDSFFILQRMLIKIME